MTQYHTRDLRLKNRTVLPEDFRAIGDGTTDDKTPLTQFINFLNDNPGYIGWMPPKTYATSGALPDIKTSGVKLFGHGCDGFHTTGSLTGTVIKGITNTGFTTLTVAPTEGASAQQLTGVEIKGITFNGNGKAAKNLIIKTCRYCYYDVTSYDATTTGIELNVSTTLGDSTAAQYNVMRLKSWQQSTPGGVPLRLIGTSTGNWSLNWFEFVDIFHYNTNACIIENADNNLWGVVRAYKDPAGSASNSFEFRGAATSGESCRDEIFLLFTANTAAIAKGTGTYTVGSQGIVMRLDDGNNTPDTTVETGAACWDGRWVSTTPTPTPDGGSFTSVSATVRLKRDFLNPKVRGSVVITNAGTGTGNINVPLPYNNKNGAQAAVFGAVVSGTGVSGVGRVNNNSGNLYINKYDGNTLISADTILFNGSIETTKFTVLN